MAKPLSKTQMTRRIAQAYQQLFAREDLRDIPADDEDRLFLLAHSYPALKWLVGQEQTENVARLIQAGFFPEALYRRLLEEMPAMNTSCRLLLTYPELAKGKRSKTGESLDWKKRLKKWNFDLGVRYPALRVALNRWNYAEQTELTVPGTDGDTLFYPKFCAIETKSPTTQKNFPPGSSPGKRKEFTYASFLHMILHCLFGHLHKPEDYQKDIWNLACDMAAEALLSQIFPEVAELAGHTFSDLPSGTEKTSAFSVYQYLLTLPERDRGSLAPWYYRDDHRFWYQNYILNPAMASGQEGSGNEGTGENRGVGGNGEIGDNGRIEDNSEEKRNSSVPHAGAPGESPWEGLAAALNFQKRKKHRYGLAPGSREEKAMLREEAQFDFSRYLQRFSTTREELQLDMDSFDYIPYHYGLELYGNMPLIEPLEYTEAHRIETLVIAMDTSGSCSIEIVQRFLAEIQRILMNRENFFRKMNVHIFQCDSWIQDHTVIHSPEEWERYRDNLTIKGRGGTDFNPVFTRVAELIESGELRDLKGLLYFTDGDGVYPKQKPSYETAFVFTNRDFMDFKIPEWIVPLCLELP